MEKFFRSCAEIDFGTISLTDGERTFCSELSNEIRLLCKSLPPSTQTQALFLLMKYFRIPLGGEFAFFMTYYVPTWSIIYWLISARPFKRRLSRKDIESARTAHSMALLLHPLDDHLTDGQIPVTHLNLLVRSQGWSIMLTAMEDLAGNLDDGDQTVQAYIDDYYCGISSSEEIKSLDNYVDLFRKQMAIGFVVPVLLSKKAGADENFTAAVEALYGSFGVAWRLLDDINDIETDLIQGNKSAVYICLPEALRKFWRKEGQDNRGNHTGSLLKYLWEHSVLEGIIDRICFELETGAAAADKCGLAKLADDLRCLASPLQQGPKLQ